MLSSKESRLDWLLKIYEDGCSLLRGVPCESDMVMKVADHIYKEQHTCYGDMFDVLPSKEPLSVSCNERYLALHADLIIYKSAPGLQLLHCLEKEECVSGGESVLVDALFAAEEFCRQHSVEFATLTKVAVTCLTIVMGGSHPFTTVTRDQSSPLAITMRSSMSTGAHQVKGYLQTGHTWASFLKNFPVSETFTLLPGDLITFSNHKMLHSRKVFYLNGEECHLQECYVSEH